MIFVSKIIYMNSLFVGGDDWVELWSTKAPNTFVLQGNSGFLSLCREQFIPWWWIELL
jgi:hypothetical protein